MEGIARELGISKKTLYQFVTNKNDLVLKVLEYHFSIEKKQDECWAQEAPNALDEVLLMAEASTKELQLMKANFMYDLEKYHPDGWQKVREFQREHMLNTVKQNLERGIREGLYRHDLHPEIIAKMHVASSLSLFDEDWFPLVKFPREKIFKEYILHYLNGILTEEGRKRLKAKLP